MIANLALYAGSGDITTDHVKRLLVEAAAANQAVAPEITARFFELPLREAREAFERIYFEQLLGRFRAGALQSQRLLSPEPVHLPGPQAALVLEHRKRLQRLVRTRLPEPCDAEDVVQEALIRAVCFADLDEARVGALLTTTALRLCADFFGSWA